MRRPTLSRIAIGLFAGLAVVGGAGAADAPAGGTTDVPLNVRVFDLDGLGWRTAEWDRFTHVGRDGAATIWTVDARAAGAIAGSASEEITVGEGGKFPGHVRSRHDEIKFVSGLGRVADGPRFQATRVAFVPAVGSIDDLFDGVVRGRRQDDGVHADVELRDEHVIAVHTVVCPDGLKPKAGRPRGIPGKVLTWLGWGGQPRVNGVVQVPEMVSSRVRGGWEVPAGKALVIGLGVHTSPRGFASEGEIRERVVVIDAGDLDADAFRAGASAASKAPESVDRPFRLATLAGWAAVLALGAAAAGFVGWRLRGPVRA